MQGIKISIYLLVFTAANLIVYYFGANGLIITAALLVPFDFVMRSYFHESWKGLELVWKLGAIVLAAGALSYAINYKTQNIAIASVSAFVAAQLIAGIFYQIFIKNSYFVKVNGSDLLAILVDSTVFQLVAFGVIDYTVTVSQSLLKILGGLFWYYVLFVKLKIQNDVRNK